MPRKLIINTDQHPYHITARSNNREWFDLPMEICFEIFGDKLEKTKTRYQIKIHAFVLMSNHFHMIVSTPNQNIGLALRYFLTETSRGLCNESNRINHIFGGRNYKSLIATGPYYAQCLKYIYRNPVRAGIVTKVEDYPWSTISKYPNKIQELTSAIDLGHENFLPPEKIEQINWFNEAPSPLLQEELARAIRRPEFHFKPSRNTRKQIEPTMALFQPKIDMPQYHQVPGT